MGTIEIWLDRRSETPDDRAIRLGGERIRRAFPSIDFDQLMGSRLRSKIDDQRPPK
jgi:hypothetical protein